MVWLFSMEPGISEEPYYPSLAQTWLAKWCAKHERRLGEFSVVCTTLTDDVERICAGHDPLQRKITKCDISVLSILVNPKSAPAPA